MQNTLPDAGHSLLVSEVEIMPVKPQEGLVAFASCLLNGSIYLGNIAIHTRPDGNGFRLVFPVKILPNGKQIHCFHPVTKEAGEIIHDAIIRRFEELIKNVATKPRQSGGDYHDKNNN